MNSEPPLPSAEGGGTALQAYVLGQIPFEAALAFQRRLVYHVAGEADAAALVLCEHPPLITVGRQGSWGHLLCEPGELLAREWRVRWVNRGGGCLLHLPGQLAIYPILSLRRLELGLPEYLHRLQAALVAVLADFSIRGEVCPDQAGVRVGGRLIASIGIAVRNWVTYFGAAFNINPPLLPFRQVRCGADEAPMTSLECERRGPLRPSLVRERFLEHFAAQFGFTRTMLFFEHPALGRKAPFDAVAASS